jgi:hypothetical protein
VNQGPQSGPLTALYAGDLVQTPRGLAPLSLEGFSEDLDEDGYVDPIAAAEPAVPAPVAPTVAPVAAVQYAAAAPVQYAAIPAVHYAPAATGVQYAVGPATTVQYAAAPAAAVQYAVAPAAGFQYAAAPVAAAQYAYGYPALRAADAPGRKIYSIYLRNNHI